MVLRGVNVHQKMPINNDPSYYFSIWPLVIDAAWTLGFRALRCDFGLVTVDTQVPTVTQRADMISGFCRDRGMKLTAVFITPFLRTSRTDGGAYPDTAQGRYDMGFNLTQSKLQGMSVKPDYVELDNEVTLTVTPAMPYNQGQTVGEYNVTKFLEIADVLKGQYDAVRANAPKAKIICGTVNSNFGYIPWLISKGINMDVAGFHVYYQAGDDPANWQGFVGSALQNVFTNWGKPVSVNEMNGLPSGNTAAQQTQAIRCANDMKNYANVESIYAYELFESSLDPGYSVATQSGTSWAVRANSQAFLNAMLK